MSRKKERSPAPSAVIEVPIFVRDRVCGWPKYQPDKAQIDGCPLLSEALSRRWPADQHFTAYECRDVDGAAVRLTTDVLSQPYLGQLHVPNVTMQLLVVDVDDPVAHEKGTPARKSWRAEERAKCADLRASAPGFVRYETRGGYRLIWALSSKTGSGETARRLRTRGLRRAPPTRFRRKALAASDSVARLSRLRAWIL